MATIFHKANSRGLADHGWLVSRHTFSFADYYNPERINFGMLRVINDDIVKPSMGFGTHPHDNMEIISIPLYGSLRHQDSMGNRHIISAGEVQVMSAGTGVTHSEYNNSETEDVNFLQIWVFPKKRNLTPRYGQKRFEKQERLNRFQLVVSPEQDGEAIWINQEAWFSLADLDAGTALSYRMHQLDNGLYVFVLNGEAEIEGQKLGRRDGLGLTEHGEVRIDAHGDAELLLMEVPMK